MSKEENVGYIFVDASNIWQAQKSKGAFFDYKKLKIFLKKKHNITKIEIFFYTAYPANGTREYSLERKHKFYTFLKKGLKFNVVKKELKRIKKTTEIGEVIKEKGDMDVEITIDAMRNRDKYDTAIFFTGDSDFLALIRYLRNINKKVFIYSSKNNISKELRVGGDEYTDVLNIKEDIWRRRIQYRKESIKK